jgi:hypothetical protein
MDKLSPAELQALSYWRLHHGRHWKAELRKAWGNHVYGRSLPDDHAPLLHGLRNRLGPTWLARFSFAPSRAHPDVDKGHSGD